MKLLGILPLACSLLTVIGGYAGEADHWYPYTGGKSNAPGAIGLNDWLDAPAGKHGRVKQVADRFAFEDGTPARFWGTNLAWADCFPERDAALGTADRFAKYGVNAVRQHKFIDPGARGIGHPEDSLRFNPEHLDRFDFFNAELRKRGIYFGFSWVFHHELRPNDIPRLDFPEDFAGLAKKDLDTLGVLVFIAPDIQDLRIAMLKNLLEHENPYTGLRYAEDPALSFVEMQNEDDLFFYTFKAFDELERHPRYKRRFLARWNDWLAKKYGTHAQLVAAWGERALNLYGEKQEDLAKANILLTGNPYYFSPTGLERNPQNRRRMMDNARFLFEVQREYYRRFERAIRDTGYRGPLVGSSWIAAEGVPFYYNLFTDHEVGFIDRHAYFGGQKEGYLATVGAKVENETMLARPGSGLLALGQAQVIDRPFVLSEWNQSYPNEWASESVPLIAAYGMGLQGWDGSYHFTSNASPHFMKRMGLHKRVVDRIDIMGQYTIFSRMVQRGDVKEGPPLGVRRVALDHLAEGGPDFLYGRAPDHAPEAMAAGRIAVAFVDVPAPNTVPDMARHTADRTITSATGQLAWRADGKQGWVRIDTPGTQGIFGFVPQETVALSNLSIAPKTPFCGIHVTSLDPQRGLSDGKRLLLMAIARVQDKGMEYAADRRSLTNLGQPELLLEPVLAEVRFTRGRVKSVETLDQDGLPTGKMLPVRSSRFELDGTRDQTPYYLITLE